MPPVGQYATTVVDANNEFIEYMALMLLLWLLVTGRLEAILKVIYGPKDPKINATK